VTTTVRRGAAILLTCAAIGLAGLAMPQSAAAAAGDCAPGTVQLTETTPSALTALQAKRTWKRATGTGVLVAVVDSGIDANNPHLRGVVVGGVNLVPDGTNADGETDIDGHGTAIAGEIAAQRIPGSGVVGLAYNARLLSVRVFRATDDQTVKAGLGPSVARLSAGIIYAASHGAQIINVSLSDFQSDSGLTDAVSYATEHGSLVIASAGNRATTTDKTDGPRYPAADPGAIGVAATNTAGVVTNDSIHGAQVALAAPGSDILTAATGAGDCLYAPTTPASSFSTGYVSAAAALVAQAYPTETPAEWAYRLEATAARQRLDQRDDDSGWGIIQPLAALTLVPSSTTRGPKSPFADTRGSAISPARISVQPRQTASALEATTTLLGIAAVVAVTLLGTLGAAIILRRRRTDDGMRNS
jgi:membrane-anchored mycosin MYCP